MRRQTTRCALLGDASDGVTFSGAGAEDDPFFYSMLFVTGAKAQKGSLLIAKW